MKKIISFIVVFLMAFMLVACGETTITIKYETNGGNTISSQEIDLDDLTNFVLPKPSKDGYEFVGWYLDSEFTKEFKASDVKEDITLYAKWKENVNLENAKSVSGTYEVINKIKIPSALFASDSLDPSISTADAKITMSFIANNIDAEDYKEIEGYFECDVEITSSAEQITSANVEAYAKEGYIYLKVSTLDCEPSIIKLNVEKLVAALEEVIEENFGSEEEFDIEAQFDEIMQLVQEKVTEILTLAAEYGLDTEFYNALTALLNILKPTKAEDDAKITFTITDEQVQTFLTDLGTFLQKYFEKIYKFGNALSDLFDDLGVAIPDENDVPVIDEVNEFDFGDYKVVRGENGWYDENGNFHSFAEDEDYSYGSLVAGYYVDNAFGCIYDITNNYTLVECNRIYGYDDVNDKWYENALFFLDDDGDYILYEKGDSVEKLFVKDDFLNQLFGYTYNSIYYIYYGDEQISYSVETGNKLTAEEVEKLEIADMLNYILLYVDYAKEGLTINKCSVTISKSLIESLADLSNDLNGSFVLDLDININVSEDETYNIVEYVECNISFGYAAENTPIEFPSFDAFLDVTDILIGYLQS